MTVFDMGFTGLKRVWNRGEESNGLTVTVDGDEICEQEVFERFIAMLRIQPFCLFLTFLIILLTFFGGFSSSPSKMPHARKWGTRSKMTLAMAR